ncbi:hypothetical protein ES703_19093 [subsurface metagenome]
MQWLINLVAERVIATIGIPPVYIDRGDPAAVDYTDATLTRNAAWHELDLSAIVPAGAKAVSLNLKFRSNLVSLEGWFRKNGNANTAAIAGVETAVAGVNVYGDLTVALDSDRKINYLFGAGGLDVISLTIKGWWL